MTKKIVITGIGVIAPNGTGKEKFWSAIKSGKSGIDKITRFDVSDYPVKIAGEVKDFDSLQYMERKETKLLSRTAQFALAATKLALDDAAMNLDSENLTRVGVIFGTSTGGQDVHEQQLKMFYEKGRIETSPFAPVSINYNLPVGVVASTYKIKGYNLTLSTGCSSGLNAIGCAYDTIMFGKADIIIAGGIDAPILPFTFNAFCNARILAKGNGSPSAASRPFDKHREGYVLAEGAGIVIVEEYEHAKKRNAHIYGEIIGYSNTNDGYSVLGMNPDGNEVVRSMKTALDNAGITVVDYICAHGSSSVVSDKRETQSIKHVFKEKAYGIPISSIKSMIGQPLSAASSLQFITAMLAIEDNYVPPTINYEIPDPDCDLNYIPNKGEQKDIMTAMACSFGMGGSNASVVVKNCQ
jgi:3-oxoacyl-[acyl-carrier-protein] synthase II